MPFGRTFPQRLAVVGAALTLVCGSLVAWVALSAQPPPSIAAQQPSERSGVIYALTDKREARRGELLAIEERTGAIVSRLTTWDEPDLLVTSDGGRLFILDTEWSDDLKTPTHTLRLVDASSWQELARTEIADRISYASSGPSGLVLAPDGSRLFVYSYNVLGDSRADYWLSVVDPQTLQIASTRIPLPNCGGARFVAAGAQVVALCGHTNDLRFIDPTAGYVVATVRLPALSSQSMAGKPADLVVAAKRQAIYVVTNDLRIVEIDVATHTLTREVTTWRVAPQSVPFGAVAISRDGQRLFVGVSAQPRDRGAAFVLRSFTLPALTESAPVPLIAAANVTVAGDGGLYLFEDQVLQYLGPGSGQTAPILQVDGRIQRLVR